MKKALLTAAVTSVGLLISGQSLAQGYYVDEQSALRLGDAFSGGSASASDASTVFYGPAAMTLVKDEIVFNIAAIDFSSSFDGSATTVGGAPINGKDAEADSLDALPSFYMVRELSDGFKMGVYINAPYATGTDFGDDSVARYQAAESDITGIDAGFALAFRINDMVSVGGSLIAQYVNAKTAVAINSTAICLGAEAAGELGPYDCAALGIDAAELGNTTYDGYFEMEGHNMGYGFALGTLIEFTPDSRLGINYRSRIAHQLSGTAEATFPAAAAGFTSLAGLPDTTASGKVTLTTPETASLSYFHRLGKIALQADYSWTKWSRYNKVQVESNDPVIAALAAEPQVYNWTESQRIALGASIAVSPTLTLRTGMAFDSTPIEDENAKVDFAFDDYQAVSLGMSYVMSDDLTLDLGIQHTFSQTRDIEQNDLATSAAALQGEVKTQVNSYAAGIRWGF
ncbi:MAG: hypothetical protein CMI03_16285 [Oceanospirillaceae bacterium]|uniref:OmpP1/FadL family transporter n=1 Tax=unclassified Thalassolituus TaxID=2624967 RepID=UPI000C57C014|nr:MULTISPECIES: outer membrane protein transport protein [unclassified Thalassolituus]MAS25780.1 hypothetical protein [Oceanospirillaceae bacterium]MBL33441.1 hypothetical protein [Oceanospirillaceae bacterium]MBS54299.1 hypothetical protein [Oceanospirillaceae bacterium]|tara:strand:+ start:6270 stop:7637 length:1368 start_codon:yes stop_codon:yes gene_type:complete